MDIQKAAQFTLNRLNDESNYNEYLPVRKADGKGIHHAKWLLTGIAQGYIENEKAHRWLGYAQAILAIDVDVDICLDDFKEINKSA